MRFLAVILAFLFGAAAAYALSIVAYVAYIELSGAFDREGALAMGVAFMIGPAVALVFGAVAAVLMAKRMRVRRPGP